MLGTKRKPINPVISGIPQVLPADLTRRCCPDSTWGMCWGAATAGAGRENPSRRKEPQELCPGCSSRGSWALCPPWGRRISPEQPQPQEPPEILHPSSPGAPSESISPPDTADQGVGQRHQAHLISFNSSGFRGFFSPYEGNWSLFFTAHPPTSKKPTKPQNSISAQNLGMVLQRIKVSMWLLTREKLGQKRCQVDMDRIQKKLKSKGN